MTVAGSINAVKHYYRGRVYEATNELDVAVQEYRKAISAGADYADVHNSLGRVLAKLGYYEEARLEFEHALRLNPTYLDARRNLEELLTKVKMIKPVQSEVSKSVSESVPVESGKIRSLQELFSESGHGKSVAGPDKEGTKKEVIPSQNIGQKASPQIPQVKKTTTKSKISIENFKSLVIIILAMIIILPTIMIVKTSLLKPVPEQQTFKLSDASISSITKYENYLILSDWVKQEIVFYKIEKNKLDKLNSIKLEQENIVPTSIVISNKKLWILDGWSKKVYKYSMSKASLSLISVFDVKTSVPTAIVAYKDNVLIVDNGEQKVIVYDQNFNEVITLPFVVKKMALMCSYKDKLWVYDKNNFLHELKEYTDIKNSYSVPIFEGKNISAFFIDEKYLWFAQEGESEVVRSTKKVIKS